MGVGLGAEGTAEPTCAGDTAYDADAPVLAYGRSWKRDGITCESRTSGLRCRNADGHGFSLAREEWEAS